MADPIIDKQTLEAAVIALLQRPNDPDVAAYLPVAVQLAEQRIFRNLRIPLMEREVVVRMEPEADPPQPYAVLPNDFLELKDAWTQSKTNPLSGQYDAQYPYARQPAMRRISLKEMNDLLATRGRNRYDLSRFPCVFAREGGIMHAYPVREEMMFAMLYWAEPPELVDPDDTHDVLRGVSELYLFATTAEMYLYLRDEERLGVMNGKFDENFARVMAQVKQDEYSGSTLTVSSPYAD